MTTLHAPCTARARAQALPAANSPRPRRINAHVDARFALTSPGRYVNDNFDPRALNARFDKNKVERRARLVATREIRAGEEIYAPYGAAYWRARGFDPDTGKRVPRLADAADE